MYANINIKYNTSDGAVHSEIKESGKYGETYVGPAYGVLIHVRSEGSEDPTACTWPLMTYSTPDRTLPVSEPWIALIQRGDCEFSVKIMHAIRGNATAVVVYNERQAADLDVMQIPSELSEYPYFVTMLSILYLLFLAS